MYDVLGASPVYAVLDDLEAIAADAADDRLGYPLESCSATVMLR
jgi:hypothetical protein